MSTEKLDYFEAAEIADVLLKIENTDEDIEITENELAERWNISLEDFHEIANGIFQMIDFGMSPITQTPYVGISKNKREWLVKKEVDQQFIAAMINWATEGENITEGIEGFARTITKSGVPEFDIIIKKSELGDSELRAESLS